MGKISYSNLLFADNNQLRLGTGSDLRIYHNGSNSFIQDSGTGDLRLMSSHLKLMDASENLVLGVQAGAVAVTGTLTVGVDDTGHDVKFFGATSGRYMLWDESDDSLNFPDNTQIKIGAAADLRLYHDGSDSYVRAYGSTDFIIMHDQSDRDIKFKGNDGGSVITALTLDMSDGGKATFNNDVVAFSDKKLKDNIETLDGKKVLDMRGVSFTRKDTGLPGSGVIAQEIQKVAPELVNETNGTLGVSYGNLVGYLIEAIKDQQKQIDELKEMCNGCSK